MNPRVHKQLNKMKSMQVIEYGIQKKRKKERKWNSINTEETEIMIEMKILIIQTSSVKASPME